jgi:prevent-host-death family protein
VAAQAADAIRSDWQLQDAKARFSKLVKKAREQGPQHVTVRGAPPVVVNLEEEFARLTSPRPSIVDHILEGPARGRTMSSRRSTQDRATPAEGLRSDVPRRQISDRIALEWRRLAAERVRLTG